MASVPRMIYGTAWKKDRTQNLVFKAIAAGFRGIDTAAQPRHYQEDLVGKGIRQAVTEHHIPRSDLYVQTKFTSVGGQDLQRMPYNPASSITEQVRTSIVSSLHNLRHSEDEQPYLDCVVLHSPLPTFSQTFEAWTAMESYVPQSIRTLGISNIYDVSMLEELYASSSVKPAIVQNRFCSQLGYDQGIRAFCADKQMVYQSFWTLTANPDLLASAPVCTLATEMNISAAAALYNLVIGLGGVSVLNGTTNCDRMREDLAATQRWQSWADSHPALQARIQSEFNALLW